MIDLRAEFERACGSWHGQEFDSLPERVRILIAIWALEAEVNNGGFDQFFLNESGDLAWFAPQALERIGAVQMASIVKEANSAFGSEGPPREWSARQRRLLDLTEGHDDYFGPLDARFQDYPDNIAALLVAYLEKESA